MLLSSAGLSAMVYGLIEAQRYDWGAVVGVCAIPEILAARVVPLAAFAI